MKPKISIIRGYTTKIQTQSKSTTIIFYMTNSQEKTLKFFKAKSNIISK